MKKEEGEGDAEEWEKGMERSSEEGVKERETEEVRAISHPAMILIDYNVYDRTTPECSEDRMCQAW